MKKTRALAAVVSVLLAVKSIGFPQPFYEKSSLLASAADAKCKDIDPLDYKYEIYPLIAPFNEYFFVKTDNPHPESFRFFDKNTPYSETSVIESVDSVYADVEYEDKSIYRVNGGYIFQSFSTDGGEVTLQVQKNITKAEFNTEIYGTPAPKTTGYSPYHGIPVGIYEEPIENSWSYYIRGYYRWEDSDITLELPPLCDCCDYLIDNYADGDDFFSEMDGVQKGFSEICLYSGSYIRGNIYRSDERDWRLTLGAHVDQSFYIYSPFSRKDNQYLLASALYPFRYDSLGFPSMMALVSSRLSELSTYEWSSTGHAFINVTYDGVTKQYGGAGNGEGQGITADKLTHIFTFGDKDESLDLEGSRAILDEYAAVEMDDDIPREDELTWEEIYNTVGDGAWVDMGGYYTYLYQKDDKASFSSDEWGVGYKLYWGGSLGYCWDTWVDGRYIKKSFVKGAVLEDHPEASVLLTKATVSVITDIQKKWDKNTGSYVYTSAKAEEAEMKNVLFRYDADAQLWKANVSWGGYNYSFDTVKALADQDIIESKYLDMLTLTREDVESIISSGNTNSDPEMGFIYDGYSPQGTPFLKGDCNDDGECSVADAVTLQKWLLGNSDTELANWRNADLVEDRKLDVFDLCMLRRRLIEK